MQSIETIVNLYNKKIFYLGDHHGLYLARMFDVGPSTEINQWATFVDSGGWRGYTFVQNPLFELVVLKIIIKGKNRHFSNLFLG